MRRINLFMFVAALLVVSVPVVEAQTTLTSTGLPTVRNSAPENVWFMFPDTTNVHEVQFGCSNSGSNANWVFVYEEQPNGFITTYPFHVTVTCAGDGSTASPFTLVNAITVNTPDHTVTIESSTNWTVVRKTGRSGYYWAATGGSSQIVVGSGSASMLLPMTPFACTDQGAVWWPARKDGMCYAADKSKGVVLPYPQRVIAAQN